MLFVSAAFVLGEVKIYFDMFIPTQFMIIPLRFAYVNNNKIFFYGLKLWKTPKPKLSPQQKWLNSSVNIAEVLFFAIGILEQLIQ